MPRGADDENDEAVAGFSAEVNTATENDAPRGEAAGKQVVGAGGHRVRHSLYVSQTLVMAWCLWLVGSWWITMGSGTGAPSVRWMIYSCLIGMTAFWPAWRLSQGGCGEMGCVGSPRPGQIFVDWVLMNLVLQTVVLPLRVTAEWPMVQALWLDGLLLSWSLLIAAVVAWGCLGGSGWHRVGAIVACLLVLLGEPALMGVTNLMTGGGGWVVWDMKLSPVLAIWELTTFQGRVDPLPYQAQTVSVAMAGVAAWVVVCWGYRRMGVSCGDHGAGGAGN